jgi:hypothetical protein
MVLFRQPSPISQAVQDDDVYRAPLAAPERQWCKTGLEGFGKLSKGKMFGLYLLPPKKSLFPTMVLLHLTAPPMMAPLALKQCLRIILTPCDTTVDNGVQTEDQPSANCAKVRSSASTKAKN